MTEKTITLTIDEQKVTIPAGSTVMDACKELGVEVPHFCYHPRLSVAGNCRMCLVEVEGGPPKPTAACAFPAGDGMVVKTQSPMVVNARKGTMELLLLNHPLDCPVCDQAGECDLQDLSVSYGGDTSHFKGCKRTVSDPDIGPLIRTVMNRCIHCMRCVRFATEVAGVDEMGATGRGSAIKVGTYVKHAMQSELSGNMIDLCPVGALNNKPYTFQARPWELTRTDSIDVMDGLGSHIRIDSKNGKILRIVANECDDINEEWISNTARFCCDGLSENRLINPMVKSKSGLRKSTWQNAFQKIAKAAKGKKQEKIAGLASRLHSAEDFYSFNAFMKQTLGTDNVDANPENFALTGADLSRSNYIMNSNIAGIDEADALLLIGCDPRFEAPVLNARIRRNVRARGLEVGYIGADFDLDYEVGDLGDNPSDLQDILDGSSYFSDILQKAETPMIIIGAKAVLTRKDGLAIYGLLQKIAHKYGVITPKWNGMNVLHQDAGAVTALDLKVFPENGGMEMADIRQALADKKLAVLFVYGDVEIPVEELKKAKFLVYIGTHNSEIAKVADVVLPTATYTEKNGWWTNIEGRIQQANKAVEPPQEAKEDWKIFRALSEVIGGILPFDTLGQLRKNIVKSNNYYSEVNALHQNNWQDIKTAGRGSNAKFAMPITEFYASNEILRASQVMRECEAASSKNKLVRKAG